MAFGVLGCKSSESDLIGRWDGQMQLDKSTSDNPMAKALEGMASAFTSANLELKADKKFTLTLAMFPLEGTWRVEGGNVRLVVESVMGMTKSEVEKMSKSKEPNGPGAQDILLTIGNDRKTLTVSSKDMAGSTKDAPSGEYVFKKTS